MGTKGIHRVKSSDHKIRVRVNADLALSHRGLLVAFLALLGILAALFMLTSPMAQEFAPQIVVAILQLAMQLLGEKH